MRPTPGLETLTDVEARVYFAMRAGDLQARLLLLGMMERCLDDAPAFGILQRAIDHLAKRANETPDEWRRATNGAAA